MLKCKNKKRKKDKAARKIKRQILKYKKEKEK